MKGRFPTRKRKKDFIMAETNAPAPQTPAPQTPQPAPKVKTASDSARSILKEFKDFISRGNVLDMAVGIIVGGCLGGPVGMVIAVPVTAALRGFFVYFFETRTGRQIVSEDGALFWSRPYVDGKGDPIPALDALDDERFFEGSRLSFSPDVLGERERDAPQDDGGDGR